MPWIEVIWTDENESHITDSGLTVEEVEHVLHNPRETGTSRSSGRPFVVGMAQDGRMVMVIYEELDPITVYPITAFSLED